MPNVMATGRCQFVDETWRFIDFLMAPTAICCTHIGNLVPLIRSLSTWWPLSLCEIWLESMP